MCISETCSLGSFRPFMVSNFSHLIKKYVTTLVLQKLTCINTFILKLPIQEHLNIHDVYNLKSHSLKLTAMEY